jgi:transposase
MIEPEKRKAIFLLHQDGMPLREIARRFGLGRNTVCRIVAQEGQCPVRAFTPGIDPDLLRQIYAECNGYAQRVFEKLQEEHGLKVKYSTLTRWLRLLGINLPAATRCDRVPDEPGAEMQHDTSPFTVLLGQTSTKLQASLLYLRYSKRRYLQFYHVFDRFQMKCFLHQALLHWGYAPSVCIIDNTNLARLRGLGQQAVIVPEMEAFAKSYGFRFICHAPKHSDRKAGEERSFLTTETNFLPGRTFTSLEDLNRQARDWSTVRMEQRPQGKAGLIPAQAFEYERGFLQQLPPHLPAPYKLLERSVDEYGYVAVEANYYWVPGTGRGEVRVLRYDQHLEIYQFGQGQHVFRTYFKNSFLKQYQKASTFLRLELVCNNLKDFGLKKTLPHWQALRQRFQDITDRFAHTQAQHLNVHGQLDVVAALAKPVLQGKTKVAGIKLEILLHPLLPMAGPAGAPRRPPRLPPGP